MSRITPVLGDPREPVEPGAHYLPFLVERHEEVRGREYTLDGVVRLFSIGKFSLRRKNHLMLLEAVRQLNQNHRLTLTLFGHASHRNQAHLQEIRGFIEHHGLGGVVTLRIDVPWVECQSEFLHQDIFVLPGVSEPAAVSHLDAMSWGLPVVCTDSNGTANYVRDSINGRVIPGGNLDELVAALDSIISDPNELARLGQRGLKIAQHNYSWKRGHELFMDVLTQVGISVDLSKP